MLGRHRCGCRRFVTGIQKDFRKAFVVVVAVVVAVVVVVVVDVVVVVVVVQFVPIVTLVRRYSRKGTGRNSKGELVRGKLAERRCRRRLVSGNS